MATPLPIQTAGGIEPAFDLAAYYPLLVFAAAVAGLALTTLAVTHVPFFKPWKPTRVKMMPYESGMDPIGSARMQFDIKFNLVAVMFLIFDVELLLLYPWAVIAFNPAGDQTWRLEFGWAAMWCAVSFIDLLVIGYLYEWRKGTFTWR